MNESEEEKGSLPEAPSPKVEQGSTYIVVATAALLGSVMNWPVQVVLLVGAFPPSHTEGVGAIIAAGVPLLFTVPFLALSFKGLNLNGAPGWVRALSFLALLIIAFPTLMALMSGYFFLMQV